MENPLLIRLEFPPYAIKPCASHCLWAGDAKMSLIMMNVGNGYKSVYDLQYEYESRVRYGSAVFLSKNERE